MHLELVREELEGLLDHPLEAQRAKTILSLGGYPGGGLTELREVLEQAIEHGVRPERQNFQGRTTERRRRQGASKLFALDARRSGPGQPEPEGKNIRRESARVTMESSLKDLRQFQRRIETELLQETSAGVLSQALAQREGLGLALTRGHNNAQLLAQVRDQDTETVRLAEFSSASVTDVLTTIIDEHLANRIELLIANPAIIGQFHRGRIYSSLRDVLSALADVHPRPALAIRCYSRAPSLRGRACDRRFVTLGWYTHEAKQGDPQSTDSDGPSVLWGEVWGQENPQIAATDAHPEFDRLRGFFERVFQMPGVGAASGTQCLLRKPQQPAQMNASVELRGTSGWVFWTRELHVSLPVAGPGRSSSRSFEQADPKKTH